MNRASNQNRDFLLLAVALMVLYGALFAATPALTSEGTHAVHDVARGGPQLAFDGDFDNGNLDGVLQIGHLYTVSPPFWLHFRIDGALGAIPEFRVYQGGNYTYRPTHRMVFRYGSGSEWQLMDRGQVAGGYYYFGNDTPFSEDEVFIAYWYPITFSAMEAYMDSLAGEPFVRNAGARGFSSEGRAVYGYQVTDPAVRDDLKKRIVIIALQHGTESLGSHICLGMSDYLIHSNEPEASKLRRTAVVHFYPMALPDDVFHGTVSTPNPNREWWPGAPPDGAPSAVPEINILRQAIMTETSGRVDYGFDIHSHPGHSGDYYYWGLLTGPPEMVERAAELVDRIHHHDAADHGGIAIIADHIAQDTAGSPGPYADYWLYKTMGAVSFTLEPGSVPAQSLERIRDVRSLDLQGAE